MAVEDPRVDALIARIAGLEAQLQVANNSRKPPKPQAPEAFNGDDKEDVDAWIFKVEQYFKMMEVNSDVKRMQYASTLLRGQAQLWYRLQCLRVEGDDAPFDSWAAFVTALRQQFTTINIIKRARDRLANLRQYRDVQRYVFEFNSLCLKIPDITISEKMDRFIRGLKPNIRKEIELREPETLEEAMSMAERVDNIHSATYFNPRLSSFRSNSRPVNNSSGPTPMDLGAMKTSDRRENKGPGRLTPEERERLRKIGGCFYCRQTGHTLDQCPLRPERPSFSKNFNKGPPRRPMKN